MTEEKSILEKFWDFIEEEKEKTKIGKKVYGWMNEDNLGTFNVFDSGCFYFEKMNSYVEMPNYIYNYLKKWGERQGYTYLYED